MTASVREWLPLDVAGQDAVRAVLSDAVEAWSLHWFRRHRLAVASVVPAPARAGADAGGSWTRFGRAVAVSRAPAGLPPIVSWLLDGEGDPRLASRADRLIAEHLEATLLGDLAARIETALGLADTAGAAIEKVANPLDVDGGAIVGIEGGGGGKDGAGVLRLAIPLALLVRFQKSRLPRRAAARRLSARGDALGGTRLRLEAGVGDVQLALADLRTLAVGDVLVLNTPLDGLAALTVEGAARPLARARLSHTEGRFSLTLQA